MELLITLLTGATILWIVNFFLAVFTVRDPYNKLIMAVGTVLVLIWMVTGRLSFLG